jgi:hypothetical protein
MVSRLTGRTQEGWARGSAEATCRRRTLSPIGAASGIVGQGSCALCNGAFGAACPRAGCDLGTTTGAVWLSGQRLVLLIGLRVEGRKLTPGSVYREAGELPEVQAAMRRRARATRAVIPLRW